MGVAFTEELERRGVSWFSLDWRKVLSNDSRFCLRSVSLVINCAAYLTKPSASLCDSRQYETIKGNILLPVRLAHACQIYKIPLAHISTGCLWSDGLEHTEDDSPQRSFNGHCGFYIGSKVMAEEEVRKYDQHYIWRVRLPFDQFDNDRNYLRKLANFDTVWGQTNSASHRFDFVKACLDLWEIRAPFGTYNMTNLGSLDAGSLANRLYDMGISTKMPSVIGKLDGQCKLNVSKLLSTGVKIRHVQDAVEESLSNWTTYVPTP